MWLVMLESDTYMEANRVHILIALAPNYHMWPRRRACPSSHNDIILWAWLRDCNFEIDALRHQITMCCDGCAHGVGTYSTYMFKKTFVILGLNSRNERTAVITKRE